MKLPILIYFLVIAAVVTRAQDTLIKRNGDTIRIKLTEVNPGDIKYKLFSYQEGPVFTVLKEEVKFVIYLNGTKESYENFVPKIKAEADASIQTSGKYFYYKDKKITETDMLVVAGKLKDPKLNHMIKKVENLKFFQNTTAIAGAALFVSGFYIYGTNRPVTGRRGRMPVNNPANVQAQKNGNILMIAGAICSSVSIFFMLDRRRHDRIVVNAYNMHIGKP